VLQNNTASGAITVGSNEGLGIVVTASGNRVEGNTCFDNPYGLRAVNSGNLIVRNMFQGNNIAIDIAAFNALGPVVGAMTNGTTETGNGGYFGDIGSLDPNANFVY
jgi:parallel beta-helix repeat protein